MKIAAFGATGGLGLQFLEKALDKGHAIIAYVHYGIKLPNVFFRCSFVDNPDSTRHVSSAS